MEVPSLRKKRGGDGEGGGGVGREGGGRGGGKIKKKWNFCIENFYTKNILIRQIL